MTLFAATFALGALLLFMVQPLFARQVLPVLGGAPGVWIVCATFFQAAVLAGYLYAHLIVRGRSRMRVFGLPLALLLVAGVFLPPSLAGPGPVDPSRPILWLLGRLLVTVGPLVLLLSATAPLLGTWFARGADLRGRDPYFLYAASNAGSLMGLLLYPLVIEPWFSLTDQALIWSAGYGLFVLLVLACARGGGSAPTAIDSPVTPASPMPRARWIFLSFVPTSLYLGFTTWVTTDLAAVPLFWVIPLVIYLAAFVAAFARRKSALGQRVLLGVHVPLLFVVATAALVAGADVAGWSLSGHLLLLAVSCFISLRELALLRPVALQQTQYFLLIAVGGVAGGLFNAVVAPFIFTSATEYPLALVLTCLCRPPQSHARSRFRAVADGGISLVVLVLMLEFKRRQVAIPVIVGACVLVALYFIATAAYGIRLALGVAALMVAGVIANQGLKNSLFAERTFYGIHRIRREGPLHVLLHGNTRHGIQDRRSTLRGEPLGYHTRSSPVGQLLSSGQGLESIAVVGLGAGALSAYGRPKQSITFFELDPLVERIARDPSLFTYLGDSAARIDVVLGDARQSLSGRGQLFDVIVLDAFSSDAIPVHLVTREAIVLYLSRLNPQGLLVFNVANRYIRLGPVLAATSRDLGLVAWHAADLDVSTKDLAAGKLPSEWVVLARNSAAMAAYRTSAPGLWTVLRASGGTHGWTDQRSNVMGALGRR